MKTGEFHDAMKRRTKLFPAVAAAATVLFALSPFPLRAGDDLELIRLRRRNEELRRLCGEREAEIERLRGELADLQSRYTKLDLWLAGVADTGAVTPAERREELLLTRLSEFSRQGSELALGTVSFCDEIRKLLAELPLGAARRARLSLRIDELESAARTFVAASENGARDPIAALKKCRVLAIDRKLGVAVISVGALDGVAPGSIFKDGADTLSLRVVAVRRRVAAAIPTRGKLADLTVGAELSALDLESTATPIAVPGVKLKLSPR